jgi:hypothetical protein
MKIGDKVKFVSKTSKGTSVSPTVYVVADVIPAITGVDGLDGVAYVKVADHHGYWKESEFILQGEDHE